MRDLKENFTAKDKYLQSLFPTEIHPLIEKARKYSEEFGKSGISMTAYESRVMLSLIAAHESKKFVEIGTLTGATAIWISESMPTNSELWTLEKDEKHAQAAADVFQEYHQMRKDKKIHLVIGDAVETLKSIEDCGPFDGIFIDGNKAAYGTYLDWAEANLREGAIIIADNVFLGGSVWGEESSKFSEKQIRVMKEFNHRLADQKKYQSSLLKTDEGLFFAVKKF